MLCFSKDKKNDVLDYAYEIDSDNVNTYTLERRENQIYRILNNHYYLDILGEKIISKLRGRGYLSMEEVYQKYQVPEIPIVENEKKKDL